MEGLDFRGGAGAATRSGRLRGGRGGAVRSVARGLALVALALLGMEAGARLAYGARHLLTAGWPSRYLGGWTAGDLDAYKIRDPENPGLVRLRPGYVGTLRSLREDKALRGRELAVAELRREASARGLAPDEVLFRIGRAGFKGPELRADGGQLRILGLGDSCTFGTWIDELSYPRALERALRTAGVDAEVVNGGVEGYTTRDVWLRLPEYRALRPRIAILYIGWNDLFEAPGLGWADRHLYVVRLSRELARRLRYPRDDALAMYLRPKHPRATTPDTGALDALAAPALRRVDRIVRSLQGGGTRVVLVTLPGLYQTDTWPTERALRIGHLPPFTDNPFVLAQLVDRYNHGVRRLARERGATLVDAAEWSRSGLRPRDEAFLDSVHLTGESQAELGRHLAAQLRPLVDSLSISAQDRE